MLNIFTSPDTWSGGSIDLLIHFEPELSVSINNIKECLWSFSSLDGPYLQNDVEPYSQNPSPSSNPEAIYGVAKLFDQSLVAFKFCIVVEESKDIWLYAGFPLGSLAHHYPTKGYPFDDMDLSGWQNPIHEWLLELAKHLNSKLSFDRGVIGWLTAYEVEEIKSKEIPESRYSTYFFFENGVLTVFQQNTNEAPFKIEKNNQWIRKIKLN